MNARDNIIVITVDVICGMGSLDDTELKSQSKVCLFDSHLRYSSSPTPFTGLAIHFWHICISIY